MNNKILSWASSADRKMVVQSLMHGQVILGSSDTVFGLLAVADRDGLRLLNKIKGRAEKPYIVLIGQTTAESLLPSLPDYCQKLARCWPGPLTLIVRAENLLPNELQAADGTVALRVPGHQGLLSTLDSLPYLFSTSANKSGSPVPYRIADVDPDIVSQVALCIVDGDICCTDLQVKPSTIIDCTQNMPRLVREGAYSRDQVQTILGYTII